eukprot:CAMPEP_0178413770 /NCGR_PEP_ID=MMETSP0689_2-20121128/22697_1 /TAXON_ID=160604 /ORGANISM="Amphidinium massartii, Strain CS-259" /LENGTH=106 /DNA_ID=CAMNT_0020035049 /DNA_START=121 /DNA_END=438 /DNA_ORIENTATION=+
MSLLHLLFLQTAFCNAPPRVPSSQVAVARGSQAPPQSGEAVAAAGKSDEQQAREKAPDSEAEEEEPDLFMLDVLEWTSYLFWGSIILWAGGSTLIAIFSGQVRDSD